MASSHSAIWRGTIPFYSTLIHLLISLSHFKCRHTTFGTWNHLLSHWENTFKSIALLLTCVWEKHLAASLDKQDYHAVMFLAVVHLITGEMNDRACIELSISNRKRVGTFKKCLMAASSEWTSDHKWQIPIDIGIHLRFNINKLNGFPMLSWVEPMASCFSPTVRFIFFIDIAIVAVAPVHKMASWWFVNQIRYVKLFCPRKRWKSHTKLVKLWTRFNWRLCEYDILWAKLLGTCFLFPYFSIIFFSLRLVTQLLPCPWVLPWTVVNRCGLGVLSHQHQWKVIVYILYYEYIYINIITVIQYILLITFYL